MSLLGAPVVYLTSGTTRAAALGPSDTVEAQGPVDTEGRTVRGFIPKTGRSDLQPGTDLGSLIRERIRSAVS